MTIQNFLELPLAKRGACISLSFHLPDNYAHDFVNILSIYWTQNSSGISSLCLASVNDMFFKVGIGYCFSLGSCSS